MDYICAKFGNFIFSRFGFLRADRQTDKQNHRQNHTRRRMIANRYTQATTVGVSNNESLDRDSSARLTSGNSWKRERFIRNERKKKNENKKN